MANQHITRGAKQMDNRRRTAQSRGMDIRIQRLSIDTADPLRLAKLRPEELAGG